MVLYPKSIDLPCHLDDYLELVCNSTKCDYSEVWKISEGTETDLEFELLWTYSPPASYLWCKQYQFCLGTGNAPNVLSQLVLSTVRRSSDAFWANTADSGGLVPGVGILLGTLIGSPIHVQQSSTYIIMLYSERNQEVDAGSRKILENLKVDNPPLLSHIDTNKEDRGKDDFSTVDADILSMLATPVEEADSNQMIQDNPHYFSSFFDVNRQDTNLGQHTSSLQYFTNNSSMEALAFSTCSVKACKEAAVKNTSHCAYHSGNRKCHFPGCSKCAQGGTKFCISHGGGRRCKYPNCTKGARDKFFCAAHGGGKRCQVVDCKRAAVGSSNRCTSHGGGRRCQREGCTKSAQSSTNFCVKHGGGRRCGKQGCMKVARGRTDFCAAHGGGNRCKFQNCNRIAASTRENLCRLHVLENAKCRDDDSPVFKKIKAETEKK